MQTITKGFKYFAVAILLLGSLISVLSLIPLAKPLSQKSATSPILLQNINIVDVKNDRVIQNQSILILDGRIQDIQPFGTKFQVKDPIVIEGNGRFVAPGLWDMHNHFAFQTAPQMSMPLYIAAGVTNVREMHGVVNINEERELWRKQINNGALLGPRIIAYADELVGANYDTQDVKELVERSAQKPHTFIKIYSGILEERFTYLANESNRQGVEFAGHYPNAIDPLLASNLGQRSFEHGLLFINASHNDAASLRDKYRQYYTDYTPLGETIESRNLKLKNFEQARFEKIVDTMIENGTYFTPTHITRRYEAMVYSEEYINDERLKLVPPMVKMVWNDDVSGELKWHGKQGQVYKQRVYQRGLELTGLAHDRGLKILAGGDTLDPYSFPGFNIHEELIELVKAGLSPAEALRAATITPAEYFDLQLEYGSVDVGKVADLILLDNNPLENIEHIRTINTVIYNGQVYFKADLKRFIDYVENNNSGMNGLTMSLNMFWRLLQDNRH